MRSKGRKENQGQLKKRNHGLIEEPKERRESEIDKDRKSVRSYSPVELVLTKLVYVLGYCGGFSKQKGKRS